MSVNGCDLELGCNQVYEHTVNVWVYSHILSHYVVTHLITTGGGNPKSQATTLIRVCCIHSIDILTKNCSCPTATGMALPGIYFTAHVLLEQKLLLLYLLFIVCTLCIKTNICTWTFGPSYYGSIPLKIIDWLTCKVIAHSHCTYSSHTCTYTGSGDEKLQDDCACTCAAASSPTPSRLQATPPSHASP